MKHVGHSALHALLSAVVDGTITESQVAELAQILESDEEARRFYVRYLDMTAALSSPPDAPAVIRRRWVPWDAIAASLTAASLLTATLLFVWASPRIGQNGGEPDPTEPAIESVGEPVPPGYIATIVSASVDAVLNDQPAAIGRRLIPGFYDVTDGQVTVQFDGGASIFFEGQPSFTLLSRREMIVHRGTFVFQGDKFCESIEIVTPHSVFKNIGTRYAAVIDAHGEEVHVVEGSVRRTATAQFQPARQEFIQAGAGMRYRAAHGIPEAIPLDAALAARTLDTSSVDAPGGLETVVDDFRGAGDQVGNLQSGSGWSEAWRSRLGALHLVTPGLAGDGSVAVRHDGSGEPPAARRSAAHRRFERPIDLSKDGIWYLRFLVRRGPRVRHDEHRAMVVLRSYGLTPEQEIERGALIQIALRQDDVAMVRVADALTRVSLPQAPGETYAVVAKIVSGSVDPEQVLVRLMSADRLAGSKEPTEWSVVSESVATNIRIDQLSLECVSSSRIEFGDVCIGPTWDSVTRSAGQP